MGEAATVTVFDLGPICAGEIEVTFGVTKGEASMRATVTFPVDTRLGALRWENLKLQSAGYLALQEFMPPGWFSGEALNAALERYLSRQRLQDGISRREGGR